MQHLRFLGHCIGTVVGQVRRRGRRRYPLSLNDHAFPVHAADVVEDTVADATARADAIRHVVELGDAAFFGIQQSEASVQQDVNLVAVRHEDSWSLCADDTAILPDGDILLDFLRCHIK